MNYPNNPTGVLADGEFFQDVVNFCNRYNILLISDNPYFDITFEGKRAGSLLQVATAQRCGVELISFSKTFNMGGWRLGAAVGNPDILRVLMQMKSSVDTGHFQPIYEAGVVALEETSTDWANQRNEIYCRRRDYVMEMLPEIGLRAKKPYGAMYIWASMTDSFKSGKRLYDKGVE